MFWVGSDQIIARHVRVGFVGRDAVKQEVAENEKLSTFGFEFRILSSAPSALIFRL